VRLDEATSVLNRKLFTQAATSAEQLLCSFAGVGKTLEEDKANYRSLQGAAEYFVLLAFYMIAGEGDERLIIEALDRGIRVAEEALRIESFNRLFYRVKMVPGASLGEPEQSVEDETFKPTAKQIKIEKLKGRMQTLECLSHALWFKNGQRPMDIFRESVEARKEAYELDRFPFEELVLNCAQVGDYEYVSNMCQKKVPKAMLPPQSSQFKRNDNYVLYVLSKYALDNRDLEVYAREGVGYRYEQCRIWDTERPGWSPWWIGVGWAYLWGKHFSGVTEARLLIRELRGY